MNKFWKILILFVVIGVMAADLFLDSRVVAEWQIDNNQSTSDIPVGTAVGELAPQFSGTTIDGLPYNLGDQRGKIVVVNVFASWCGPCILETPHLVEAYNSVQDQGVSFVGINLQENAEAVAGFQQEFNINYPLVLDPDGELTGTLYRPIGLPTTWFIDPDGIVQYAFSGAMTQEILLQILDDIRAGRQPDPFVETG